MTTKPKLPFDDPEYWLREARSERAFASDKRSSRYGTSESIRIHESNAEEYEARARALSDES